MINRIKDLCNNLYKSFFYVKRVGSEIFVLYLCFGIGGILFYLFMRQTFKALLLPGIFYLMPALLGFSIWAQDEASFELRGCWLFEKAEYLEQSSPGQGYQLKYTIENEDDLGVLGSCYQEVVRKACFYDEETAKIICMFTAYIGSVKFPFGNSLSVGEQYLMVFGDTETIGKSSPIEGMVFNAPQIEYQVELVDKDTIHVIIEKPCYENGVNVQGLVKCVLTRETEELFIR